MRTKGSFYFSLSAIIIFLAVYSQLYKVNKNKEQVSVERLLSADNKVESLESVNSGSIIKTKTSELFILNYYDSSSENFEVSNLHQSIHLSLNDESGVSFLNDIEELTNTTDTAYVEKLKYFVKQNINKGLSNR